MSARPTSLLKHMLSAARRRCFSASCRYARSPQGASWPWAMSVIGYWKAVERTVAMLPGHTMLCPSPEEFRLPETLPGEDRLEDVWCLAFDRCHYSRGTLSG